MDIVDHVHGRQDDFKSKLLNDEIGQIERTVAHLLDGATEGPISL